MKCKIFKRGRVLNKLYDDLDRVKWDIDLGRVMLCQQGVDKKTMEMNREFLRKKEHEFSCIFRAITRIMNQK